MSESIRMGVAADNGDRSPYWKVTAGRTNPDVYVHLEKVQAHVSLHASGDWHFRVTEPLQSGQRWRDYRWQRPVELAPGTVRCAEFDITNAVVRPGRRSLGSRREAIYWHPAPTPAQVVAFNVLLEAPDVNRSGWPQKPAGATLVGRLSLPNRWTACVVAQTVDAGPNGEPRTISVDDRVKEIVMQARGADNIETVVMGELADGTQCFRLMRVQVN